MFKFERGGAVGDTTTDVERLILEKEAELESYQSIVAERELKLSILEERRSDLQGRITSLISNIASKLDNPSAYEDFADDAQLPNLKAELRNVEEEISKYDNLDDQRRDVEELRKRVAELKSANSEVKDIDAEIARLSKDPNGEREESHRRVAKDVDDLVDIRTRQLKEIDKAESIIAILESLDEEQKKVFLAKLKPSDMRLYESYKSGALITKHEKKLKLVAENQDSELFKEKEKLMKANLEFIREAKKVAGHEPVNKKQIKLLSKKLGVSENEICTNPNNALKGGVKYYIGDLNLSSLTSAEGLTLPQSIGGDLFLNGLTSAEGLTLPQSIGGDLNLDGLKSTEGITLPEYIGGYLGLGGLTSAEGLTLPQSIGGDLRLSSLTSAEGLNLPEHIGRVLFFNSLPSHEVAILKNKYKKLRIRHN